MDASDIELRNATYRQFVAYGRPPTVAEVATELGLEREAVVAGWRRLHRAHALVLDEHDEIRMANPFSAVETPFRVEANGREWYANCAWDALGIGAALHVDSTIDTACADCGEPVRIVVRDGQPDDPTLLFHVLVPAAEWWQDIGFT